MKKFHVGVKGIVRDAERGVLLLKRDYKSGDFWDTPGGRIDGDETFAETLNRELGEELPGISNVKIGNLLGAYRLQKDIEDDISLVLLYFEVSADLPDPIVLSDEHDGLIWIKNFDEIPSKINDELKNILTSLFSLS